MYVIMIWKDLTKSWNFIWHYTNTDHISHITTVLNELQFVALNGNNSRTYFDNLCPTVKARCSKYQGETSTCTLINTGVRLSAQGNQVRKIKCRCVNRIYWYVYQRFHKKHRYEKCTYRYWLLFSPGKHEETGKWAITRR